MGAKHIKPMGEGERASITKNPPSVPKEKKHVTVGAFGDSFFMVRQNHK